MQPNPKLFISFTGTMAALVTGLVKVEDLKAGLFVFGCTRGHAITPGAAKEYVEPVVQRYPELHAQLVAAVLEAEAAGRVRWRGLREHTDYPLVNELLTANGYQPLMPFEEYRGDREWMTDHYNLQTVAERSRELQVVWCGNVPAPVAYKTV
jgi:hypothetical protein